MASFCTQCGHANEPSALFCDECGERMLAAAAAGAAWSTPGPDPRPAVGAANVPRPDKRFLYGGLIAAGLALAAAAAISFGRPPPATEGRLLAAARLATSSERELQSGLCIANLSYNSGPINTDQTDRNLNNWMGSLVEAGLYAAPVATRTGGIFPRTVFQYVPSEELSRWTQGSRLCIARSVTVAGVEGIGEVRSTGAKPDTHSTRATVVLRAVDAAPWLRNSAVADAIAERLPTWDLKDGVPERRAFTSFVLRGGTWQMGSAQ